MATRAVNSILSFSKPPMTTLLLPISIAKIIFAFPLRYLPPSFNSTLPTAAVMSAATIASGMPLVAMTARMAL